MLVPAAGRGDQLVPWGKSIFRLFASFFSLFINLAFFHQNHELVQHCKGNCQLLRMLYSV